MKKPIKYTKDGRKLNKGRYRFRDVHFISDLGCQEGTDVVISTKLFFTFLV